MALKKILLYILWFVLILYILYNLLCLFVCTYKVNSYSMFPTIKAGDKILVEKSTLISRFFNQDSDIKSKYSFKTYQLEKIKRNDIVVFNKPFKESDFNHLKCDSNTFFVKRVIGVPGDTVAVRNSIYFNNNFLGEFGKIENQKQLFIKTSTIKGVDEFGEAFYCYPYNDKLGWNIRNMGPLFVPKKGCSIELNYINYVLYCKYIEYETGEDLIYEKGLCYIRGEEILSYSFKKNYYFMGGDNVQDSQDSRYYGLVPEDFIIGEAILVLYNDMDHSRYMINLN